MIIQIGFQDQVIGTGQDVANRVVWSGKSGQLEDIAGFYERQGFKGRELLQEMLNRLQGRWWAQELPEASESSPATDFAAHSYASTQVNLAPAQADLVIAVGKAIPDADLGDNGREDTAHITVQYGILTDDPAQVIHAVEGFGPIRGHFLGLSIFPASEQNSQDVLKYDVVSDDLHRLKLTITSSGVPHEDKWPNYHPHCTVAYLKAGRGADYVWPTPLDFQEFTFDILVFNAKDGTSTPIPLRPVPQNSLMDVLAGAFESLFAHDVSGQDRDGHGRWTSSGSHEISGIDHQALAEVRKHLGSHIQEHDIVALAGAPPGTKVTADMVPGGGSVYVMFHSNDFKGERMLNLSDKPPWIKNEEFKVLSPEARGSGLGTSMLASQVEAAVKHGFGKIETEAGGRGSMHAENKPLNDQSNRMTGYYAWARMGYDGPLNKSHQDALGPPYSSAKTIHELMAMPGGPERWKVAGKAWKATFDLKEGSRSRAILRAYARAKGISADFAQEAIDGGLLSQGDDEIFGKIWQVVQEHGWDALETADFARWAEETGPRGAQRWRNLDNPGARPSYREPSARNHEIVRPGDVEPPPVIRQKPVTIADPESRDLKEYTAHGYTVSVSGHVLSMARKSLGNDFEPHHFALLGGAFPGCDTLVTLNHAGDAINLAVRGKNGFVVDSILKREYGTQTIHNMKISAGDNPPGTGLRNAITQVASAIRWKFSAITLTAAGEGDGTLDRKSVWNGYYTWPRLGWDAYIPDSMKQKFPPEHAKANTLQQLFAMPGGPETWYRHGRQVEAKFDLSPGSRSVAVLREYANKKNISTEQLASVADPANDPRVTLQPGASPKAKDFTKESWYPGMMEILKGVFRE